MNNTITKNQEKRIIVDALLRGISTEKLKVVQRGARNHHHWDLFSTATTILNARKAAK